MNADYDVIVVGARCAGSPTAMLLARKGYRVLLVDKATFPSDTMSTHIIHPPGVAALKRWHLLQRLQDTGCPAITKYSYDFGPITISGPLRPTQGVSQAYCPRRIVLDKLLVDAAIEAGAELQEGFTVDEILIEEGRVMGIRGRSNGGAPVTRRARVVVGADGLHSVVAKAVRPQQYNERPTISAQYYAYWSGLPTDGLEVYIRPDRAFGLAPTNNGLTMGVIAWPRAEFETNRRDVEGNCLRAFELAPNVHERVRSARLETRFVGTGVLPNFFRKPYGAGWVLVGDAGYHKDPVTAQGISDAFRSAEAVADALDDSFAGRISLDDAMACYQRVRDDSAMPIFQLTCEFARIEPPPPEMQQLLGAVCGNEETMSDFVSVLAGTVPPPEFFGPENVGRIMAQTAHS
ncbi:flavin-dependent dehydrogenase [Bradyrhizobium sp. AZCC 1588]|uniref:NAD(P)/FAD-dependent oxidoreductase n=1 Tax=unclassified Bradyrhizobium TaxID=2631580 RepID=UPI002FEEA373